jgi:hypothetical protein
MAEDFALDWVEVLAQLTSLVTASFQFFRFSNVLEIFQNVFRLLFVSYPIKLKLLSPYRLESLPVMFIVNHVSCIYYLSF